MGWVTIETLATGILDLCAAVCRMTRTIEEIMLPREK